jgi:glycosyltransferase 2 family protein
LSSATQNKALKTFKSWKIYLAIGLGLVVSAYQFYKGFHGQDIYAALEQLSHPNWYWLLGAILVLIVRDLGYMYRIKNLTRNKLNWKSSFYTIMLWEFASAITPSVVGGTAVAMFILNKEGIKMGKAIAYVTLTAILDNIFFILAAPFGMYFAQDSAFFSQAREIVGVQFTLASVFYISYSIIAVYTLIMAFGVLINPKFFQKLVIGFVQLFRLSKGVKNRAYRMTFDNITAARELRKLRPVYWVKAILSTLFVWLARYFMLNCLLAAYFPMDVLQHQEAFGKQLVLWVSQLISPTPGASGFAEIFMRELFGATFVISSITLLWRFLTYYTYIGLGAIFFSKWIKTHNEN